MTQLSSATIWAWGINASWVLKLPKVAIWSGDWCYLGGMETGRGGGAETMLLWRGRGDWSVGFVWSWQQGFSIQVDDEWESL